MSNIHTYYGRVSPNGLPSFERLVIVCHIHLTPTTLALAPLATLNDLSRTGQRKHGCVKSPLSAPHCTGRRLRLMAGFGCPCQEEV